MRARSRFLGLLLLAGSVLSAPAAAAVPPGRIGPQKPLTPESSLKVRSPGAGVISPDGSSLVLAIKDASFEENTSATHLYLLSTGTGALRPITTAGTSNSEPSWSPDGTRIAFTSARDGAPQIYILDLARGGEAKKLTDLPGGASGAIWSPDGARIALVASVYPDCKDLACNKQRLDEQAKHKVKARVYDDLLYRHWNEWDEGTRSHLFVVPSDGSAPPLDLTPGRFHVPSESLNAGRGYAFAGNDTLVYCANVDKDRALSTNNDLFLVSTNGLAPRAITTNKALDANPVVSPDGRHIAYVAFARPGFESDRATLMIYDRTTTKRTARSESLDRSIEDIAWMPDGTGLYATAYNRGFLELYSIGLDAGEPVLVLEKRGVQMMSVSSKGTLSFIESSFTTPPEAFIYDPPTRTAKQISHLNDALATTFKLGDVDEIEIDNAGTRVHGFINYPPDFNPRNRYPLVVLIHGGPQGAFLSTWHSRWNSQLFAARGYVVAMPNFRGSIGYGQKFTDAVTKDWGGGAYEDVMTFVDALTKRGFIDERWMCAAGASYGGYLVNWIAGHTQRFRCLISHAGVFNLESMWGDTEELWFPEWELGGAPWTSREMYRRWSPHEYIQNAKTPTLVIHGQLDYRVNLSQGQQMFTSLERLGVPARFLYFPDEGHWITKPQNYVFWYNEMLGWLGRYLR